MRKRIRVVGLLVACSVLAAACDWPVVGGGPARSAWHSLDNAITPQNVASLAQRWKATLHTATPSDPIVANGHVYVTTSPTSAHATSAVQAFDAAGENNCSGAATVTCTALWSRFFPPAMSGQPGPDLSPPATDAGNVYFGAKLFEPATNTTHHDAYTSAGTFVYQRAVGDVLSPIVDKGRLYASVVDIVRHIPFTYVSYLAAFDAATGAKQFIAIDEQDNLWVFGPPAVDNNTLYGIANHKLYAYDATGTTNCVAGVPPQYEGIASPKSCRPLWKAGISNTAIETTPVVANGFVYTATSNATVPPRPPGYNLTVFSAGGCGAPTCSWLWSSFVSSSSVSAMAVTSTAVFVGSTDGSLYAFPAKGCGNTACPPLWKANLGAPVNSPSVGGSVVFVTAGSHLYGLNANGCGSATCSPLFDANLGAPSTTAPAVSDGRVFVTDDAGVLHAYAVP